MLWKVLLLYLLIETIWLSQSNGFIINGPFKRISHRSFQRINANQGLTAHTPGQNLPESIQSIQPLHDFVLLEKVYSTTSPSGIFLNSNTEEDSWHGVVIAKPNVATDESKTGRIRPINEITSVNVGDHVIVNAPWGERISQTMKVGDRYFALQPAEKIIAVVK